MEKMKMTDEKVIQMIMEAKESNNPVVADLEAWLHPVGNRGWYTCQITGKKIRGQKAKAILAKQEELMEWVVEQIEQEQIENAIAEEQTKTENDYAEALILGDDDGIEMTDSLRQYLLTHPNTKTIVIDCVDCGKKRRIKPQDAFQVKRCISCQKKYRNKRRAERYKQKRQKEKAQNTR